MKSSQTSFDFKHFGFRTIVITSLALALCGVATAQNPVVAWNDIAVATALGGKSDTISRFKHCWWYESLFGLHAFGHL